MTLTRFESVRPSRAGSVLAIAPDVDFEPTNVDSGVSGGAVNRDGSAAVAAPTNTSCPASRDNVATAADIRLMCTLLQGLHVRPTKGACLLQAPCGRPGCAEATSAPSAWSIGLPLAVVHSGAATHHQIDRTHRLRRAAAPYQSIR